MFYVLSDQAQIDVYSVFNHFNRVRANLASMQDSKDGLEYDASAHDRPCPSLSAN